MLLPLFQGRRLLPAGSSIAAGDQPHNWVVVPNLHSGAGSLCCHAVQHVEGIQEAAEDTALWHSGAEGQP